MPCLRASFAIAETNGPSGTRFSELAAVLGRIEQIAGVHALRQHHQFGALAHRLLHQLRREVAML